MAFENVQIRSTKTPPGSAVTGWRQDLAVGDVLVLELTSTTGVSSFRWLLVGRPEGSTAGGVGPEPIQLGTGSSASFVVDSDAPYPRDGTYIVHCVVNEGTPSETRITWGGSRLSGLTTSDGRVLRMLGGYEVAEDTADPLVRQGYNKMLERWFRFLAENASGAGFGPTQNWDPNNYYTPGSSPGFGPVGGEVSIGSLSSAGNIDWGVAQLFGRGGTITDIACYTGCQTTGKLSMSLYASDPANTTQPTALLHSFECTGGGFGSNFHEAVSIPVAAGDTVWFVITGTAAPSQDPLSNNSIFVTAGKLGNYLGTDWDPLSAPASTIKYLGGIKKARTYAFPPPDPFPTLAAGLTDIIQGVGVNVPIFMYRFQQS